MQCGIAFAEIGINRTAHMVGALQRNESRVTIAWTVHYPLQSHARKRVRTDVVQMSRCVESSRCA